LISQPFFEVSYYEPKNGKQKSGEQNSAH